MKPNVIGKRAGFLATARYHLSVLSDRQFFAEHGGRKSRDPGSTGVWGFEHTVWSRGIWEGFQPFRALWRTGQVRSNQTRRRHEGNSERSRREPARC
jgi:hypothetical protein